MRIALERPDTPAIVALIDALDAYQKPLYPAESHHGIDMHALTAPGVLFAVARDGSGEPCGCGAVVLMPALVMAPLALIAVMPRPPAAKLATFDPATVKLTALPLATNTLLVPEVMRSDALPVMPVRAEPSPTKLVA